MKLYRIPDMNLLLIKNDESLTADDLVDPIAVATLDEDAIGVGTILVKAGTMVQLYSSFEPEGNRVSLVEFEPGAGGFIYVDLVDLRDSHLSTDEQTEKFIAALDMDLALEDTDATTEVNEDMDDEAYSDYLLSLLDLLDKGVINEDQSEYLFKTLDEWGPKVTDFILVLSKSRDMSKELVDYMKIAYGKDNDGSN